ncbi:MAG TPA: heparin lyase I family protein [Terriglobales bacterium]|nr:heparin lyase I family protein [Terriglobales bacterium]
MKRFLQAFAVLVLLGLFVVIALHRIPLHVYDGFESSRLSWSRWSRWRFVPGAVAPEQAIVRSGYGALAITVHSGDRYEAASDTGAATERDELMESWWLYSRTGRTYAYSFSLYLPKDFPQTSERLVIAQWRQLCEARRCRPDYPILALRLEDARLRVTRRNEKGSEILYQGTEDVRGRWLDFRFLTRFDSTDQGSVDATLDGRPIVRYRGPTVFQPAHGYPSRGLVYFKTGLYRDARGEPPWTIYVDEYRKDQCAPSGCD